jgi:signal transduction histidine kinase
MFGYTIDELMGLPAVGLYQDPDDRVIFIDEVRRKGAVKDRELALKRKDGTPIWCSVSATAQFDEKNEIRWMDGVIEDITQRKNIQDALHRSKAELESRVRERTADLLAANTELRKLAAYLQSIREEERIKVAREIHDELGQSLMALKMDVSWLCSKIQDQDSIASNRQSAMLLLDETIRSVKRICTELRPGILDNLGIVAAIEWQAAEFQKRTGITCNMQFNDDDPELDDQSATAIFRIFQEALTNIAKHADATEIKVLLEQSNGNLVLSVIDNGKGISEEDILKSNSFGLLGMRERVHSLGGTLEIHGLPGRGTSIIVKMPRFRSE